METTRFTSEFFAGNRSRLRELFRGTAPIVLTAAGQLQQNADMAYPFQQDASFWYFTGIDEPGVVLVIDKDKDYLIVPMRDERVATFDGAIDEAALRRTSGVDLLFDAQTGWKRLGARLSRAKHVATLPAAPAYIEQLEMYTNPARRQLISELKSHNEQLELLDISQHITRLRMIKQPQELAAIEQAIAVTARGLKQVARTIQRGAYHYEYEIEADLTRQFRRTGAAGHGFPPIVAGGKRACTLHYQSNNAQLAPDELVLCDVGATVNHYAADISRTFSLSASPSRRQQAVYDAVLEVQRYALGLLKPGVILKEYEKAVETFMGEQLRELGLIKTIEPEAVRKLYPHSTSHFLGLSLHDIGLYDEPLEPGTVLTVEPGIYIADESLGVRIEDDIVITPDGNRVLSAKVPKTIN